MGYNTESERAQLRKVLEKFERASGALIIAGFLDTNSKATNAVENNYHNAKRALCSALGISYDPGYDG